MESEYILVPITDERIKVGATIVWWREDCVIEAIKPVDGERTSVSIIQTTIHTATLDNGLEVYIKREATT